MFLAKLKLGVAVVLALALCGGAGGLVFYHLAEAAASSPRGAPLLLGAPLPAPPTAPSEPTPRTIRVPSEFEGVVLGIFTEIKPNEKVADKDVIVVGKQKYRRLRVGDEVMEGQLVARVNDAAAADEVAIREAKLQAAQAELVTAAKTKEEAKSRYDRMVQTNMRAPGTYSNEEISAAKLTWERYVQEEMVKKANVILEERQLLAAKRIQQQYEIRSPVHGVLKVIHVQKGEAVKKLETVVEILPQDENQ